MVHLSPFVLLCVALQPKKSEKKYNFLPLNLYFCCHFALYIRQTASKKMSPKRIMKQGGYNTWVISKFNQILGKFLCVILHVGFLDSGKINSVEDNLKNPR